MLFHFRHLDATRRGDSDQSGVVTEREHGSQAETAIELVQSAVEKNCNAYVPRTNAPLVGNLSAAAPQARNAKESMLDRLKRVFVVPFIATTIAIAVYSAHQYVVSGAWPWLGPLVVAGGFDLYLAFAVVARRARTPAYPLTLIVTMLAGIGLAGYAAYDDLGPQPLYLAAAASVLITIYLVWYSHFAREASEALTVGQRLPDIELEERGEVVRSTDLLGKPAVLLFYRGNWCPLCMAQIREVAKSYRQLAERGVEVVLISGQPHDKTEALSKRFDVPFRYWVDPELRAAKRLGIFHPGATPMGFEVLGYDADGVLPTVVVIDAEGTILLADQTDNYRVRPEPQTFLDVLDAN